jgi:hypothetical protein
MTNPRDHAPLPINRPRSVLLAVEVPKRPGGVVTVSTVVGGDQAPLAAALGRLALKARPAMGLDGEGEDPRLVARVINASAAAGDEVKETVAGERRFFARVLNAEPVTGENGHLVGRFFVCPPIVDADFKDLTGLTGAITARPIVDADFKDLTGAITARPIAGEDAQRPSPGIAQKLARLCFPARIAREDHPPRPLLRSSKSLTGVCTTIVSKEGQAGAGGRLTLVEGGGLQLPNGRLLTMPMHSAASRLAVGIGAVAIRGSSTSGRRFYSMPAAGGQAELGGRVGALEVRSATLESRTSHIERRMKKMGRALTWMQIFGGGLGLCSMLGTSAVYIYWDPVKVRAFLMNEGKVAATEYGWKAWEDTRKRLVSAFTLSTASNALHVWTFGYLGSSFDMQARHAQMRAAEELRWKAFLRSRPPKETYFWSSYIWWKRETSKNAARRKALMKHHDERGEGPKKKA